MSVTFGKPNYSGSGNTQQQERVPYFKLGHKTPADRTLIARIAPPYGAGAEKGVWRRFVKNHFGYTISFVNDKGEKRDIPQTFLCIEDTDRDGNVRSECPECNEIKKFDAKLKDMEAKLKAEGKSEADILTATQYLRVWLKAHNIDKKWHMVAKNVASQWGYLTISYSAMKLLMEEIKKLGEAGIDPLSPEKGVWFRFTRTGTFFNEIKDTPVVEMEEVEGGMFRRKYDALTASDLEALAKLPELHTVGKSLTFEQIQLLVKSGGDEQVVRTVFNLPTPSRRNQTAAPAQESKPASTPQETKPAAAPAPAPAAEEDDEVAKAMAALAAAQAKKKAAQAAAAQPPPAAKPATPGPNAMAAMEMPMDEFLAQFEK